MARTPIPLIATITSSIRAQGGHHSPALVGGRDKAGDFEARKRGLLAGWEAPRGMAELPRVTGNEGPWGISRPSWEGPLLPSPVPDVVVRGSQPLPQKASLSLEPLNPGHRSH